MSTEAKRRRALEGAGSTSTGTREAGAEGEEGDGRSRPWRPRMGVGGGGGGGGDGDGGDDGLEASSPSLPPVRPLFSVADTIVSSSRDRSAAREGEGPRRGRSGSATVIGDGRRRVRFFVVGIKEDADAGKLCW